MRLASPCTQTQHNTLYIYDPVWFGARIHVHAQNEYEFLALWKTVKWVFDSVARVFYCWAIGDP